MRTISVSVSEADYEAFRAYASRHDRSIAELVRDAMAFYRQQRMLPTDRLERLPLFPEAVPLAPLPTREEVWDEMTQRHF